MSSLLSCSPLNCALRTSASQSIVNNPLTISRIAYAPVLKRLAKLTFQCAVMLCFSTAFAGSPRSHAQSASPSTNAQIRVSTNEVIAPVTVTDPSGEFVLDLSQKDFHVFDDGRVADPFFSIIFSIDVYARAYSSTPPAHNLVP